jgi:hypothetical protein
MPTWALYINPIWLRVIEVCQIVWQIASFHINTSFRSVDSIRGRLNFRLSWSPEDNVDTGDKGRHPRNDDNEALHASLGFILSAHGSRTGSQSKGSHSRFRWASRRGQLRSDHKRED